MKLLHTADWHLGIDLHKMSLVEDQRYFLKQLEEILVEENIDIVLIAGDVYDTILASREAIELYNEAMTMICLKLKKQVVIIAGNHDSPVRLASCADLLAPMGLHVIGKIEEKVKGLRFGETVIYPIPFFHPNTIRNVYQDPSIVTPEDGFRVIAEDLRSQMKKEDANIVMAHTFMAGSEVCESDRFAQAGGSELVSSKVFEGFDYVALGHLHRHQKAGEHARYSGSPLPYSFSEAGANKCVLIYDTQTKEIKERTIQPLHPLVVLQGNFEKLRDKMAEQKMDPSAYVKIEVSDSTVSYEMLEYFRQGYDHLLQLSGKGSTPSSSSITLELHEMEELQDLDIVKHFFQDYYEEELDEDQIQMFLDAKRSCEEGEYES